MSIKRRKMPDVPMVATVRGRGRVTLPKRVRDRLSLAEGDRVFFQVWRGTLELIPVELVTREELWSLTGAVRDRIEAAEADLSAGRSVIVETSHALASSMQHLIRGDG